LNRFQVRDRCLFQRVVTQGLSLSEQLSYLFNLIVTGFLDAINPGPFHVGDYLQLSSKWLPPNAPMPQVFGD
jgi:hypothetical protein